MKKFIGFFVSRLQKLGGQAKRGDQANDDGITYLLLIGKQTLASKPPSLWFDKTT
jgi:hypothetical protein